MIKQCVVCGGNFEARNSRRKTCSKKCSRKYNNYLTKKHYWKNRIIKERECVVCGEFFEVVGMGSGKRKTCSFDCSEAWARSKNTERARGYRQIPGRREEQNAKKRNPPFYKQCTICGNSFLTFGRGSQIRKTCSYDCADALLKLRRKRNQSKQQEAQKLTKAKQRDAFHIVQEVIGVTAQYKTTEDSRALDRKRYARRMEDPAYRVKSGLCNKAWKLRNPDKVSASNARRKKKEIQQRAALEFVRQLGIQL